MVRQGCTGIILIMSGKVHLIMVLIAAKIARSCLYIQMRYNCQRHIILQRRRGGGGRRGGEEVMVTILAQTDSMKSI